MPQESIIVEPTEEAESVLSQYHSVAVPERLLKEFLYLEDVLCAQCTRILGFGSDSVSWKLLSKREKQKKSLRI